MTTDRHTSFLKLFLFFPLVINSQEITIFKVSDFDLKGPVKQCVVGTDYGKEEYHFDPEGYLVKSVTRFNEGDYEVAHYKIKGGELLEKRLENYRNNALDKATSIANIYELDTLGPRSVTENIITYDKTFLDRYEYNYDTLGRLKKIIRTNNDGIDETTIETSRYKDETTTEYRLNGSLVKSIRTSEKKDKKGEIFKIVLEKEFIDDEPNKAEERTIGSEGSLTKLVRFQFDVEKKTFVPFENQLFEYSEKGMLSKTVTENNGEKTVSEFVYQFDDSPWGNWVREIVTPDNTYRSRKIVYYEIEEPVEEE